MSKELEKKIAELKGWNRSALVAEWGRIKGGSLPKNTSPQFMARVIAYIWQEEIYGGLPRRIEQQIALLMRQQQREPEATITARAPMKSGTTLRRLWQGKIYEVSAAADGFFHDGKSYRSLSEVARTITGTRWNGYVFFGLKKRAKAEIMEVAE